MKIDQSHSQLVIVGPILNQKVEIKLPQIAVDRGLQFAVEPILWVGDGDSSTPSQSIPQFFKEDQNVTDLHFCLHNIRNWKWFELHLFGFLGGRKDHELANLGEVYHAFKNRKLSRSAIFYDQDVPRVHLYQSGRHEFSSHDLFSVLVFEESQVTIEGSCEYQCENIVLKPFSGKGVSNVGHGMIQIQSSQPFLIFFEKSTA